MLKKSGIILSLDLYYLTMSKKLKIASLFVCMMCVVLFTFADRGISKKSKSRVALNIPTKNNFKNALSVNLKSGLTYNGSLIAPTTVKPNNFSTSLITYQKGNTTYILPYKQRMVVTEVKQGYAGMKLIIKTP